MTSLLPKKHISFKKSYFGYGAFILKLINKKTIKIEELWKKCNSLTSDAAHSFNDFILALDFLYMINAISLNDEGEIICLN